MTGTDLGNECEPRRTRPATVKLCWLEFMASQEFGLRRKTNKGPPYLRRRKEARSDAAMANVPPQAIGRPGAEGNDWASRHTARQAWPLGMVHSVGGARRRKSEYSYKLGGLWEKSPMVRPLIYDRGMDGPNKHMPRPVCGSQLCCETTEASGEFRSGS